MIRSKKRLRNRSGFALVHQLTFIAIMPLIMVAAITWIHQSMKMTTRFKHRRETHVTLNQLANQFQDEVRGCKSLKLNEELNQIELTGHEDQQITFAIDGSDVEKTLTVDGAVVGRESYRLSEEYFTEWDVSATENDSTRVALNVFRYPTVYHASAPDSPEIPDPKLELVITAKANRWNRSIRFGRDAEATTETTPENGEKE